MFYLFKPKGQSLFTPEIIIEGNGRYLHEIKNVATNITKEFPTWNTAHAHLIHDIESEQEILLKNMQTDIQKVYTLENPNKSDSSLWRRDADGLLLDAIQWTDDNTSDILELLIGHKQVIKVSMKSLNKLKIKFKNDLSSKPIDYIMNQFDYISINSKDQITIFSGSSFEQDYQVI